MTDAADTTVTVTKPVPPPVVAVPKKFDSGNTHSFVRVKKPRKFGGSSMRFVVVAGRYLFRSLPSGILRGVVPLENIAEVHVEREKALLVMDSGHKNWKLTIDVSFKGNTHSSVEEIVSIINQARATFVPAPAPLVIKTGSLPSSGSSRTSSKAQVKKMLFLRGMQPMKPVAEGVKLTPSMLDGVNF